MLSLVCTIQPAGKLQCLPGNRRIMVCTLPHCTPLSSSNVEKIKSLADIRWYATRLLLAISHIKTSGSACCGCLGTHVIVSAFLFVLLFLYDYLRHRWGTLVSSNRSVRFWNALSSNSSLPMHADFSPYSQWTPSYTTKFITCHVNTQRNFQNLIRNETKKCTYSIDNCQWYHDSSLYYIFVTVKDSNYNFPLAKFDALLV